MNDVCIYIHLFLKESTPLIKEKNHAGTLTYLEFRKLVKPSVTLYVQKLLDFCRFVLTNNVMGDD